MARPAPVLAALLLLAAAARGQAQQIPVQLEEARTATAAPRVTFPQLPLTLVAERPAGMPEIPGLSPRARYAVVRLGDRTLRLAFDAPEGAFALGLLYTGAGEPVVARARGGARGGLFVDFEDVRAGHGHIDVRLHYQEMRLSRAGLQPSRHRRGRTALGGVAREVILVDAEGDGAYDGPDDRWIALRPERSKEVRQLGRSDLLLLREPQIPFEDDGRALMVEKVARDGSSLVLRLDAPRVPLAEVLDRRYGEVREGFYARFEQEQETFAARNGLDRKRPRVKEAVRWPGVPLSEARARARAERKPLLAFFFTESNAWCFRYEYYTFPDREVDALLRKFVLVRIDAEKDEEQSYAATGARGMPCLVPFTADGAPVRFRVRMRDPETGKVADLAEEETLLTGWQRPEELATNLERILKAAGAR